jgi:cysteine desulfurase
MIYLDNSATTQPDKEMLHAVAEESYKIYGNPSSQHEAGMDAKDLLEDARLKVADVINARPSEVYFTSGGTEANAIALTVSSKRWCSALEHSSVYNARVAYGNFILQPDENGHIADVEFQRLEESLKEDPYVLVSVMWVNNETGVLLDPCHVLWSLKEKYGFILHVDAVQAFGKIPIDVDSSVIDMLTISGHKVHALKGVGALYVNRECPVKPNALVSGGPHELGLRPGTENMIGIRSLGYMASKIANSNDYKEKINKVATKRDRFEKLLAAISHINGSHQNRVSTISNLYFPDLATNNNEFLDLLSAKGVCASAGSACSSGMQDAPSRVLTAMYRKDPDRAIKSVRFSLSVNTTDEEINEAARIIKECAEEGA